MLLIWLESVNRWSETDESAFKFPLALWRTTPHRGYLVQVINDVVPHWFETWTELELLSDSEWKQYAVDTLLNSHLKQLQQINDNGWLSRKIINLDSFLQIDNPDIEKLIAALCALKVRFCHKLNFRGRDMPLVKRVYQEKLYELNPEMLVLWLSVFYNAAHKIALEKSYTYLISKPDESLSHRVEADFPEYLDAILNQADPSFSDTPQTVLALLNHPKNR